MTSAAVILEKACASQPLGYISERLNIKLEVFTNEWED